MFMRHTVLCANTKYYYKNIETRTHRISRQIESLETKADLKA